MSTNVTATMNGTQSMLSCFNPTARNFGETLAYCLLFLVSLIGNTFIGIIVFKTKSLRKPINFLIFNMAMSDMIPPIFLFPRKLVWLHTRSWLIGGPLGQTLCKLSIFFSNMSTSVSVQSLVLITVDRFVAVVFPLRCPFISSKQCRFFILATWIIAMAGWCPDLFAWKVVEYPERLACEHDWNDAFRGSSSFRNYLMTIIVVMYYVPLILVAILYFSIDIKIKSQKNPGEQSTNARERRLKREKNVLKLSIAIVLGFALCWLPFSILWFMLLNSDRTILTSCGFNYFSSVAELLALSNCAINPWICVCFVGNYRQGLKNLFCRSSVGTKVNQVTPY
ncbi:RYamide receptor-like isoform X1 [Stylophora pistillata]|uniref:RYamide receptor-like isoform X1 n=1 Tax=Stylophora pistillata TaxID=50429 RepID=UPI000C054DEC|nr:RYamide receptor-like isoform X1 [Stylophora pistillata]XP_022806979.1 RYamide receptor-like isoform X1 [Stylophora pistillata]XP_022806980.1 RYamide receptor-like isoform X1 [Stylophora pistillata]